MLCSSPGCSSYMARCRVGMRCRSHAEPLRKLNPETPKEPYPNSPKPTVPCHQDELLLRALQSLRDGILRPRFQL